MTSKLLQYVENEFSSGTFYAPSLSARAKARILAKKLANVILRRHYKYPRYDFFWTNALQAIALLYTEGRDNKRVLIKYYHDRIHYPIEFVDSAMHGYVLIKLRERGIYVFDEFIHRIYFFLESQSKRSSRRILPYRDGAEERYFVDTLAMVCPFLMAYGKTFKKPEATRLAYMQMQDFLRLGMDGDFPFHAYDNNGNKLGAHAWGRGIGWMLWGMVDMLEYMDDDSREYSDIKESFLRLSRCVESISEQNGYLGYNLLDPDAHLDHSVTAMFGYAVARGLRLGLLDSGSQETLDFCAKSILKSTDSDGVLLDTSGECNGLGAYSESYGNYPWGQAPAAIMLKIKEELDFAP